ncbi:MAG: RelA/SpoT family protein [Patescibacteria group bacterium]
MPKVEEILNLINEPSAEDVDVIKRAYSFAEEAHREHKRYSGEPYFIHVFETARILAEFGMRGKTVAAGLLHDTIEDTDIAPEELKEEFGEEIFFLVEGVTKLGKVRYQGMDRHNESLRKLFMATAQDIRVIIIRLADRLHNIRTLEHVPERKQRRIAKETLDVYAPIAYRLGIQRIHRELEDNAFPYVYPQAYKEVKELLNKQKRKRHNDLDKFRRSIIKEMTKQGIKNFKTDYRVKGLYSLYLKYLRKGKDMNNIYDILAVRIIVPTVADCYNVLGIIHGNWRLMPNRIKDYISFQKPNGYQSLHTTVFTGDGTLAEVQIKTEEMHIEAEYGIASHIAYKEGSSANNGKNWISKLMPFGKDKDPTMMSSNKDIPYWIKELLYGDNSEKDSSDFVDSLRSDLFEQRIFVFTPKGDVIDLPLNASPIDFAYAVHSDIGDKTFGAKVNDKMASLDKPLQNGDTVEIQTKSSSKPTEKWLRHAKTTLAQRRIRTALSKNKKESYMYPEN